MKGFRYKPVGWKGESHRHYLAAKGIKTKVNPIVYHPVKGKAYVAVGTDAKGRTVRQYALEFKQKQSKLKFKRTIQLEKKHPAVLKKIEKDLSASNDFTRQNAEVAYIIAKTGARPGSDIDTKADVKAYGITTLEDKHAVVVGNSAKLKFIGKKGVQQNIELKDKKLREIVKRRKKESTKQLFPHSTAASLRNYLRTVGVKNTKDLRTVHATKLAKKLNTKGVDQKKVVEKVATELGNTPAVTRASYISPEVFK